MKELLEAYPVLRLITGDALFAQRPLIQLIRKYSRDYLFQVKCNQGDTLDALENCFAKSNDRPPATETTEKRGSYLRPVGYGWI